MGFTRLVTAALCLAASLAAQAPSPAFGVASIRPSTLRYRRIQVTAGGRFHADGATLVDLMQWSYGLVKPELQIEAAPDWAKTERYAIEATPPPSAAGVSNATVRQMVRALLAERFRLAVDRQTRRLSVYELAVVHGGKLTSVPPPAPPAPPEGTASIQIGDPMYVTGRAVTMARFCEVLSLGFDRMVVDKTGLAGNFSFQAKWSRPPEELPGPNTPIADADILGASVFSVLPEQLGLKLNAARGPVEVLVITHAERPAAN